MVKSPDVTSPLQVGDKVTFLNPHPHRDMPHLIQRPHVLVAEVLPGGQYKVKHEVYGDSSWQAPAFGPYPRDRLGRGW
jgi:hypothetical protein